MDHVPFLGRKQVVGGLLDAVVREPAFDVFRFEPAPFGQNQAMLQGLGDPLFDLQRTLSRNQGKVPRAEHVAEDGGCLQQFAAFGRKIANLAGHQFDDIVRDARIFHGVAVPGPRPFRGVELDQGFAVECFQILVHEIRVAARLFRDQQAEFTEVPAQGVQKERPHMFFAERAQAEPPFLGPDAGERVDEGVAGLDLVVPV